MSSNNTHTWRNVSAHKPRSVPRGCARHKQHNGRLAHSRLLLPLLHIKGKKQLPFGQRSSQSLLVTRGCVAVESYNYDKVKYSRCQAYRSTVLAQWSMVFKQCVCDMNLWPAIRSWRWSGNKRESNDIKDLYVTQARACHSMVYSSSSEWRRTVQCQQYMARGN